MVTYALVGDQILLQVPEYNDITQYAPGATVSLAVDGHVEPKAYAYTTDSRDANRHAQDLVVLATIALTNPRAVLQPARPPDRKAVRRALRSLPTTHSAWRSSSDETGARALLERLASSE